MTNEQIISIGKVENNAYAIETSQYKILLNKIGPKGMYISWWEKESKKTFGFYSMSSIVYVFANYWNSEKAIKRLFTDLVLETSHRMMKIYNRFLKC